MMRWEVMFEVVHCEDIKVLKNLKSCYTLKRDPRGFGFVQYVEPADAAEAKYQMDGQILLGRELTVVFAEENRKKPADMRARERVSSRSRSYQYSRRSRYSRSPRRSRSRSPTRHARSRSRSRSYYSPSPRRYYSRSASPRDDKGAHRERSYSRSPSPYSASRSRSPERRRASLSASE